jgi:8-oxo-dGTP pyrophosphatase MutT (NUDIX family)
MSLPPINRITALAPIKLARNCLDKLATAAVPKERKHNIVIVGIRSGDTFHLLRRHPNDPYEANRLDNVVGHVDEGETYERTAHREIREETSLPSEKMVGEGAATLYDLGSFLWPMTLRTPKGTEPSFVRGRMYVLYASEVDAKCIKLNPDEHVEVVSMSMPEIHKWFGELCVFDQFYFSVNGQRLTAMPLRK